LAQSMKDEEKKESRRGYEDYNRTHLGGQRGVMICETSEVKGCRAVRLCRNRVTARKKRRLLGFHSGEEKAIVESVFPKNME